MGVTSFAQHLWWQLRAWGFNPLIRASDRLEALAVLSVLATAIFALPVAAQAGTMFYDAGVRTVDEQVHSRHSVEAVAVEDSATVPAEFDDPSYSARHRRSRSRF